MKADVLSRAAGSTMSDRPAGSAGPHLSSVAAANPMSVSLDPLAMLASIAACHSLVLFGVVGGYNRRHEDRDLQRQWSQRPPARSFALAQ
jgi:hypothetical protein